MIHLYALQDGRLTRKAEALHDAVADDDIVWIDALDLDDDEKVWLRRRFRIDVGRRTPTSKRARGCSSTSRVT